MRRGKNSGPEPSARGNFTPPSTAAAPPAGPDRPAPDLGAGSAPTHRTAGRLSPRNWRVPARLNAILLIPVLVGLVMGGFQVKGSIDTWQEAEDAAATARLVRSALTYANRLLDERDVSAAPLLRGRPDDPAIAEARKATDEAAAEFDVATRHMPDSPSLKRRLETFRKVEGDLVELRTSAYTGRLPGVRTEEGYVAVQHPLMEFANELGLGTSNVTAYGRTVYAISLGKASVSLQRSVGMHLLVAPGPSAAHLNQQKLALSSYAYLERIAMDEYAGGGTPEDVAELKRVTDKVLADVEKMAAEAKEAADARDRTYTAPPSATDMVARMAALPDTGREARAELAEEGVTPDNWWAVSTLKFDGYRTIEADLADKAVDEAAQIADGAQRDAILTGSAVVIALLTAFLLAGLVARQMSHSMNRLRTAAFQVAEERLPLLVDQLSRAEPGRVDTRVQPIPIHSTDEIGEVARAFDQVHREAVRLAAEQALLRGNINAIFTNLSRRNQSLVEGQLTLITELENNEADPDQLASLFRLDHLATRMRRNGENLLILAGEEPGSRWDQAISLVDVLRAASSEVEQYDRIELSGVPEAEVHGRAVTDLVHLLAELLENATSFSSPQTRVRVTATRLPDARIMIEIHDKGIGLAAEDFADINHRLADPPTVDAAISQRMGLFVVGRLADRHGVRVQLRPSGEQAGTTSLVMLPAALTSGAAPADPGPHGSTGFADAPGDGEFTVPPMIPEQRDVPSAPLRTAADLGFDDSRYPQASEAAGAPHPAVGAEETGTHPQPHRHPVPFPHPQDATGGYPTPQSNAHPGQPLDGYGRPGAPAGPAYPERPAHSTFRTHQAPADPFFPAPPVNGHLNAPQERSYPEDDRRIPDGIAAEPFEGYAGPTHQAGWQHQPGPPAPPMETPMGYPESVRPADADAAERVGFARPEPTATAGHGVTDVGLPRRSSVPGADGEPAGERRWPEPDGHVGEDGSGGGGDWRSANDDRWQRAEQLRRPKAGGVTASGLPRRVPKANLVEGTAEQTPQGGPQVSRAPEDVRGRLSNLRRGVQRGRRAGSEKNGQTTGDEPGGSGSTYHQER
ncbi:nitrate- and nitrite sensing domain-containing protein [Streptomyces sp. NPDC049906]|uniref:sensor histidine kinase n=1 Tax=Streptomyces sp. NPDC049906 TaxID=3155656 RepID=UPI00343BCDAC